MAHVNNDVNGGSSAMNASTIEVLLQNLQRVRAAPFVLARMVEYRSGQMFECAR